MGKDVQQLCAEACRKCNEAGITRMHVCNARACMQSPSILYTPYATKLASFGYVVVQYQTQGGIIVDRVEVRAGRRGDVHAPGTCNHVTTDGLFARSSCC